MGGGESVSGGEVGCWKVVVLLVVIRGSCGWVGGVMLVWEMLVDGE